ncbi:Hypothetical protein PFREUD_04710 [Propionibacterium freudenreichii subsp. shermanii CIRM-BIA1]|uniref:Uncharacterized protein n=1 Tax=Propionibacterium freudenreichii subsp. shermanii (strain ATCC 9614 / DSM 4902 / CIP 103027 / NCIMB 8099 / CIRM-BIA1) TaxID=754252 RepID=D7GIT3_PROFC|nr:Hypothetical protein PFREUD_04710 [Propionibacterium freudenreichii subsp. shermanii CIRM-BIA1]
MTPTRAPPRTVRSGVPAALRRVGRIAPGPAGSDNRAPLVARHRPNRRRAVARTPPIHENQAYRLVLTG